MSDTAKERTGTSVRDAARVFLNRGVFVVPVPHARKGCVLNGWPTLRLTVDDVDTYFNELSNIAVLHGTGTLDTIDVDLDCTHAINIAPHLLPTTSWIFGRKSRPKSHWVYSCFDQPSSVGVEYTDVDGAMLVELRGRGLATVHPPSVHEDSGEAIRWDVCGETGTVDFAALHSAVCEIAAGSLLARHWPIKGSREKCYLALSGALLSGGWTVERTERFVEVLAQVTGDEEGRKRIRTVVRTEQQREQGKPCTGWRTLGEMLGDKGTAVVQRARQWLGMVSEAAEPAVPDVTPWPAPMAAQAFHGLAGRIVRVIEPASEADPAALLVQILVAFGNAAGRSGYFRVESDRHYANEFVTLVGRTSKARKGTSWGRVEKFFRGVEETWASKHIVSGLSSSEGLIWAVRDPIQKRERIKDNGEVRYEEVEFDPGIEDKRLLVYEPEFANVLKQTERQGNTLSVTVRQAWDSHNLRSLVKNSPASATGAHISLVGHITSTELNRYLTETESANGFANRFLYVCADRSKLLPEGGEIDPIEWSALVFEMVETLTFARSMSEVKRDDDARVIWAKVYGELSEGKPGLAGALLARAEAHVMRLALLFAMLDQSALITTSHLMAALAVWDYCERSVRYIFGDSLGDPVADELLRLLRSSPAGVTRTDIRDFFNRNAPANRIGKALGLLLQEKLARREYEETGGRKAERWYARSREQR